MDLMQNIRNLKDKKDEELEAQLPFLTDRFW
jgi:hypothetical protein